MSTFTRGDQARKLFDRGLGCNAIARELGVAPATISAWAKREKLSFDRAQVSAANEAKVIDGKARRLAISARLYTRTERLIDRLEAPTFKTLVRTEVGVEKARELDFVPTQSERDLAHAISLHLASAARLDALNGDGTTDHAKSLLQQLGEALGINGSSDSVK